MPFVTEDNITALAEQRWATAHPLRLAGLMMALVRHLHALARETRLTEQEWLAAIEWLTAAGQASDGKRQEFILASDVLGLSMLVVQLGNRFSAAATPATVLGPFHIDGSPLAPFGSDLAAGIGGTPLFITGKVTDTAGRPLPGVLLDVWQADADGYYEAQLADVDEARLRAKYQTREDGTYCVRTIAPRGDAIPVDGPVGALIGKTDISYFRSAHVHFLIDHPGYEKLATHLFRQGTEFLDSDVVFGARDQLIVPFTAHPAGPAPAGTDLERPYLRADYDFVLQPGVR